jgi:hypothetical protein
MSIVDGYQGVVDAKRSNATPQTISNVGPNSPNAGSDFSIVSSNNIRGFSSQNVVSPPSEPTKIEVEPLKPGQVRPGYTAISADPRVGRE